jgi:Lon protease-like protein
MTSLPLFPLRSVLFPGGQLHLKVFEARYLDLVATCLRERTPFGVVALQKGQEVQGSEHGAVSFEHIGCVARILEADCPQPGIMQVRCQGEERFEIVSARQEANGLWTAQVRDVPADALLAPTEHLVGTARSLAQAIANLKEQGQQPFLQPFHFESAGWIANRWCELLPISNAAKQRLMELDDPLMRLQLVDEYLRGKGVIQG